MTFWWNIILSDRKPKVKNIVKQAAKAWWWLAKLACGLPIGSHSKWLKRWFYWSCRVQVSRKKPDWLGSLIRFRTDWIRRQLEADGDGWVRFLSELEKNKTKWGLTPLLEKFRNFSRLQTMFFRIEGNYQEKSVPATKHMHEVKSVGCWICAREEQMIILESSNT